MGQLVIIAYKEQGDPQIALAVPLQHCNYRLLSILALGKKCDLTPGALKLSTETRFTKVFL